MKPRKGDWILFDPEPTSMMTLQYRAMVEETFDRWAWVRPSGGNNMHAVYYDDMYPVDEDFHADNEHYA